MFGVLHTRFEILRREFKTWDRDVIIAVTNVCVILNNIIVRMQQKGEFLDETGPIDVVSELLEEEEQRLGIQRDEYDVNLANMAEFIIDDEEAEIERLLFEEYCLTNVEGHHSLTDDVIELVRRRRLEHDVRRHFYIVSPPGKNTSPDSLTDRTDKIVRIFSKLSVPNK